MQILKLVATLFVVIFQVFQCHCATTIPPNYPSHESTTSKPAFLPAIWIPETESKCTTTKVNINTTTFDFTWKLDGLWEYHQMILSNKIPKENENDRVFKSNREFKLNSNGSEVDVALTFQLSEKRMSSLVTLMVRKNQYLVGESAFGDSLKNSEFKAELVLHVGTVAMPIRIMRLNKYPSTVEFNWGDQVIDFSDIKEKVKDMKDVDMKLVYKFTHYSIGPNLDDNVTGNCNKEVKGYPDTLGMMLEVLQAKPMPKMDLQL